jgi:hypothetical protein
LSSSSIKPNRVREFILGVSQNQRCLAYTTFSKHDNFEAKLRRAHVTDDDAICNKFGAPRREPEMAPGFSHQPFSFPNTSSSTHVQHPSQEWLL